MKILIVIFMIGITGCRTLYWSNMNNINAPIDQSKTYNNSTVIENSKPSYYETRSNEVWNDYYQNLSGPNPYGP